MEPMTVRELLTATGGRLLGEEAVAERTITGVETDSRAVHEGDLFVALESGQTGTGILPVRWRPAPPAA